MPDLGPLQATPILDLSSFLGVPNRALGLNDLGTVVGSRNVFGLPRGFSRSADSGIVDLDWDTTALAVNDRGEIPGQDHVTGTGLGARIWTSAGTMNVANGVAESSTSSTTRRPDARSDPVLAKRRRE